MEDVLQITTTTAERADAERIAKALVEARLVACVQIGGPIQSIYHWQGAVAEASEWRCEAKTSRAKFAAVAQLIAELHPYDVPEIIATPVAAAADSYLHWMAEEIRGEG